MSEDNIYKTPEADLGVEPEGDAECLFFPTSQKKLVSLFIATFGLYAIYWFYKNWKLQQGRMVKKINPPLRSVFYIFFTHSLFKRVEEVATDRGIAKTWGAGLLATLFVVLTIASSVLDRISARTETIGLADYASVLIVFVLVYPLYLVQNVVNTINDDVEGRLNSAFSLWNILFIIMGVLLWLLVGIGLLQPELGFLDAPVAG